MGETLSAHYMGSESPKQMAKCLSMLRTTDGYHLVIRNPLALCYISHMSSGEHPPIFTILRRILCGACRCQHGRDAKGHGRHL